MLGFTAPATAQLAAAIVEDVQGKPAGIEFMDYVSPGKVIKLGAKDTIVLGYLKSCWRETITGGTVTVGAEQSTVQAGTMDRAKVPCDSSYGQLTEQQQGAVGATVFRSMKPNEQPQPVPGRHLTIYGTSPVVDMKGGGTLVIERIDTPGERHSIIVNRHSLVKGKFYDVSRVRWVLTPGGSYVARLDGREKLFSVHAQAQPQKAIVGRLLQFD